MPDPSLVVLVSVLGTLAAIGAIGGAALLAGAYMGQRVRLHAAEQRNRDLDAANAQLRGEIKQMRFARNNKLYRHALEDYGFAMDQCRLRMRSLREQMNEEFSTMDKLMTVEKG